MSDFESVTTDDGFTVETNTLTSEEMKKNLGDAKTAAEVREEKERVSKAASELGKKGGEAAAKAKAEKPAEAKAEPEKEAKKAEDPRLSARARVEEATRQLAEQRRRNQELERKLAEIEAAKATPQAQGQPAKQADGKPKVDDFASYEEYTEALAEWKGKQLIAAEVERLTKQSQETQQHELRVAAIKQAIDKGRAAAEVEAASDPVLKDRVNEFAHALKPSFALDYGEQPLQSNCLADEILTSSKPLAVMGYLVDHPDEVDAILNMPDRYSIVRAVASIESRLGLEPKPAQRQDSKPQISQAKPPVRPVSGAGIGGEPEVDTISDFDEYVRKANARDFKARAGR